MAAHTDARVLQVRVVEFETFRSVWAGVAEADNNGGWLMIVLQDWDADGRGERL